MAQGADLRIETLDAEHAAATARPVGFARITWARFRARPGALASLAVLLAIILMTLCAPLITPGVTPQTSYLFKLHLGVYGPTLTDFPARIFGNTAPGETDLGLRSVLAEVTYGGRTSLGVAFLATLFTALIGVPIGAVSGYHGGALDTLFMRVTDLFLALPFVPLAAIIFILAPENIALLYYHRVGITNSTGTPATMILIFTIIGWPLIARLIRSEMLRLRETGYAEAARASGVSMWRIIFRHLLPNAAGPLITAITTNLVTFLVGEATLDFLTIGISTTASWGNALARNYDDLLAGAWWAILFPGLFLVITVIAISAIGDALRDAVNVRDQAN